MEEQVEMAFLKQGMEDGGDYLSYFKFPPEFTGFKGHFPSRPILPAVMQLAAVRKAVEKAVGRPLALRTVTKARFKAVVIPGETITIRTRIEQEKGAVGAGFTIFKEQETVALGRLWFEPAPSGEKSRYARSGEDSIE